MKKIIVSLLIVLFVVIICILVKILFFNKTVPTGDQNGKFLTNFSSEDMLGNWDLIITKKTDNMSVKSTGVMNISSLSGSYFYGIITISKSIVNKEIINGGTVNVEGNVYNDIVTINLDYDKNYLNIKYNAKLIPKINNNHLIMNLNDIVKDNNKTSEYIINLIKKEVYNNEK